MKMISELPENLVREIVSRVPLICMKAVRLTCKKWDTLSKSRIFSKMHIARTMAVREGETMMIALMDYNLYLMSVFLAVNPYMESNGKLTCLNGQVKISQVFHCEGLLLCVLKEDDSKVVVWNPYTAQTRCIELRYSHRPNGWDRFSYALGYEDKNSCRSYKFLRFIDKYYHGAEKQFFWYEIYDFDSGLWTTLDFTPHWRIMFCQRGVPLKGNTYWPASQRNTRDELDDRMICFDFTSEKFGPLLHMPFNAGNDDYVTLSCVREEKLAVLLTHNEAGPEEFEVWVSTKIEAENVSWSKFLRRENGPYDSLITGDSFLIDEEKKVVMGFEEDDRKTFSIIGEAGGYFREINLGKRQDIHSRARVCSYVPSLAQIRQPAAGGKRKQQSDVEKHQYDQNISKIIDFQKRFKYW